MSRIIKIIIVFFILDIIGGGLLWYGYTGMRDKKNAEAGLRKELIDENQKGQKMIALRNSVSLAEADRKLLEMYLFDPSDENQIKFISQMERLGVSTTGAHVEVRSLERSGALVRGEFGIVGSWSELHHLLMLVETLPTRVIVNRFDIKREVSSNGSIKNMGESWTGGISIDLASLKSVQ